MAPIGGSAVDRQIHLDRAFVFYDYVRIEGWVFPEPEDLFRIDLHLDGIWTYSETQRLGEPSPDIALHPNCRFTLTCLRSAAGNIEDAKLSFSFRDGPPVVVDLCKYTAKVQKRSLGGFSRFIAQVEDQPGARVLEIGSRARSGVTVHHFFKDAVMDYVGFDIMAGENVDVVADAHEMSRHLPNGHFDFCFSVDVFEHLAMPWKVVLEINKLMKPGGLVYIATPQTCGMHDMPWDFWRFSDRAMQVLFNQRTGFEIVEAANLIPMHIVPFHSFDPVWANNEAAAGFFQCEVIAKKVGETELTWDVPLSELVNDPYPA